MRTQEILTRLSNVKKQGSGFTALCPNHPDKNNSLSISVGDNGGTVLHCFTGCTVQEIVTSLGIKLSDLFNEVKPSSFDKPNRDTAYKNKDRNIPVPDNYNWNIKEAYNYVNENGELLYQRIRQNPTAKNPKPFTQRRPAGNGKWIDNLDGVHQTIYKLPELIQAVKEGKTIYFVEGEKDASSLIEIGLSATTLGSSTAKWRLEFEQYFKGANIVILPDNDTPGRAYSQMIANALSVIAKSIIILELPGLADKQDVSDWLELGHTKTELLALVDITPEWEPVQLPSQEIKRVYSGSEILGLELKEMEYLLMGGLPLIVQGFAHILSADPKQGKTELTLQSCLGWKEQRIIYISEESPELWKLRLSGKQITANDINHISFYFPGTQNITVVLEFIRQAECNLIIIDTLRSIIRPNNENDNSQITADLLPLISLSREKKTTLIVLHHNKKADDEKSVSRSAGGFAIVGLFDKVLSLTGTSEKLKLTSTGRLEQDSEVYLHWTDNGTIEPFDADKDDRNILLIYIQEQEKPISKEVIGKELNFGWRKVNSLINQLELTQQIRPVKSGRGFAYEANSQFPLFPQSVGDLGELPDEAISPIPPRIYTGEWGNTESQESELEILNVIDDSSFIDDEQTPTESYKSLDIPADVQTLEPPEDYSPDIFDDMQSSSNAIIRPLDDSALILELAEKLNYPQLQYRPQHQISNGLAAYQRFIKVNAHNSEKEFLLRHLRYLAGSE